MHKLLFGSFLLLFCVGCGQTPPTNRYSTPDLTMEVSMRLLPRASAMAYLLDLEGKQVQIEARIVESSRVSIRSIGLWNGREFLEPVSLVNADDPAPSMGIGFGVGMGSSSGKHGRGGTGHPLLVGIRLEELAQHRI